MADTNKKRKGPTPAQLAALQRGRAAKRAATDDDAAPRAKPTATATVAARAKNPAIVVAAMLLAGILFAFIVSLRSHKMSPGGDLVPWRPGPPWRARPGQFIAPAAAQSLEEIGASLDCSPMTLDVSRAGGGPNPPHASHQTGLDVDIRMSDLTSECRASLQAALIGAGWTIFYDGPDAVSPAAGGRHLTHLHARYPKE